MWQLITDTIASTWNCKKNITKFPKHKFNSCLYVQYASLQNILKNEGIIVVSTEFYKKGLKL